MGIFLKWNRLVSSPSCLVYSIRISFIDSKQNKLQKYLWKKCTQNYYLFAKIFWNFDFLIDSKCQFLNKISPASAVHVHHFLKLKYDLSDRETTAIPSFYPYKANPSLQSVQKIDIKWDHAALLIFVQRNWKVFLRLLQRRPE